MDSCQNTSGYKGLFQANVWQAWLRSPDKPSHWLSYRNYFYESWFTAVKEALSFSDSPHLLRMLLCIWSTSFRESLTALEKEIRD